MYIYFKRFESVERVIDNWIRVRLRSFLSTKSLTTLNVARWLGSSRVSNQLNFFLFLFKVIKWRWIFVPSQRRRRDEWMGWKIAKCHRLWSRRWSLAGSDATGARRKGWTETTQLLYFEKEVKKKMIIINKTNKLINKEK